MPETLALIVLAGVSPLLVSIAVSLLPVGLFIMAFLLFRRSTRARRVLMTPKGKRLVYIGLAVLYLLIGLSNVFTGRSLLYVVLFAAMSILCLALAVRQQRQPEPGKPVYLFRFLTGVPNSLSHCLVTSSCMDGSA